MESTVTSGVVGALHHPVSAASNVGNQDTVFKAIQTDAPMNLGNSGGALADMSGALVGLLVREDEGIVTAMYRTAGES